MPSQIKISPSWYTKRPLNLSKSQISVLKFPPQISSNFHFYSHICNKRLAKHKFVPLDTSKRPLNWPKSQISVLKFPLQISSNFHFYSPISNKRLAKCKFVPLDTPKRPLNLPQIVKFSPQISSLKILQFFFIFLHLSVINA